MCILHHYYTRINSVVMRNATVYVDAWGSIWAAVYSDVCVRVRDEFSIIPRSVGPLIDHITHNTHTQWLY